jgi:hypothetical protein
LHARNEESLVKQTSEVQIIITKKMQNACNECRFA